MAKSILFCSNCRIYTLKETCPECGGITHSRRPAKFSPEDKYAHYRREYKKLVEDTVI